MKQLICNAIDLHLPSGTLWADRNVGAESPTEFGNYYRWGETEPYTEKSPEYQFDYLGDDIAGTVHDAATANVGKEWAMPSKEQIEELLHFCTVKWAVLEGTPGVQLNGPNGNHIFLPAAGVRQKKDIFKKGEVVQIWGATRYAGNYDYGAYFDSERHYPGYDCCLFGCTVRPVVSGNKQHSKQRKQ